MSRLAPLDAQLLATLAILAWGLVPTGPAAGRTLRLREVLQCDEQSRADYERMERGYYEHLLDAGRRQLGTPAGLELDAATAAAAARSSCGVCLAQSGSNQPFSISPRGRARGFDPRSVTRLIAAGLPLVGRNIGVLPTM